jgi:hypothetical protein
LFDDTEVDSYRIRDLVNRISSITKKEALTYVLQIDVDNIKIKVASLREI